MHALNHIACYAVRGSLRTDEAQRLLGVTAGDLEDLNIAVVELREETYTICGHALVLRGRTLPPPSHLGELASKARTPGSQTSTRV